MSAPRRPTRHSPDAPAQDADRLPNSPANTPANTFFALVPPAAVRDTIAALQHRVAARLSPSAQCVAPANFHVTLAFFGALPEDRLPLLKRIAGEVPMPRGRLELDRLGVFPAARVGWLGPGGIPAPLARFRSTLAGRLEGAGFVLDARPWTPHLTLYRRLRTGLPTLDFEPIGWNCDGFELLRTESGPEGPEYRSTGRWIAGGEG